MLILTPVSKNRFAMAIAIGYRVRVDTLLGVRIMRNIKRISCYFAGVK